MAGCFVWRGGRRCDRFFTGTNDFIVASTGVTFWPVGNIISDTCKHAVTTDMLRVFLSRVIWPPQVSLTAYAAQESEQSGQPQYEISASSRSPVGASLGLVVGESDGFELGI